MGVCDGVSGAKNGISPHDPLRIVISLLYETGYIILSGATPLFFGR